MIHIVLGTKAQLIKMAPVMRAMIIWVSRCLVKNIRDRKRIFKHDSDGIVLVHGDTFSTILGALMAKISGLRVGHVESGLRSFRWFHPFPEELTRVITFWLSDYYFCPTNKEKANLSKYDGEKIVTNANTLYDALMVARSIGPELDNGIPSNQFALVTIHRFENISSKKSLTRVVDIVERIADSVPVVFVLHKPTDNKLISYNLKKKLINNPNTTVRERMDYFSFVKFIEASSFVVSDGGSNQEECYYMGKPILLLREATERFEGLGSNCVLSHYDERLIEDFVKNYDNYARKPLTLDVKPSEIIAHTCQRIS